MKTFKIAEQAIIFGPELAEIGDNSRVCDFANISAGKGVTIGKCTDIQVGAKVWGGGELVVGDYVTVGPNTVLLTAIYDYQTPLGEPLRMVDFVSEDERHADYGLLTIEDDVYIGANCTIMPDITLGEGSIIGAGALVTKCTEPWSINVGVPAKKVGERPPLKARIGELR